MKNKPSWVRNRYKCQPFFEKKYYIKAIIFYCLYFSYKKKVIIKIKLFSIIYILNDKIKIIPKHEIKIILTKYSWYFWNNLETIINTKSSSIIKL